MKRTSFAPSKRNVLLNMLLGVLALGFSGCLKLGTGAQGGSGSGGSSTGGTTSSDPCDAWKISYCKAVSKCSSFELRDECQDDVGYVICRDDAPVESCTKKIDKALKNDACEDLPTDCGADVIADRSEPYKACKDIYGAICEWSLYCSASESVDTCMAKLESDNSCSDYTAVLFPNLDACLAAYGNLQCGDSPPTECNHILRK